MPYDTCLPNPAYDPLAHYVAGVRNTVNDRPIPLVSTRIVVSIDAGLARVLTERTFHNAESESIEATLTIPVPVHATLLELKARFGERTLVGQAQSRSTARQTYETALDAGKSAVLHEEPLRGVHMISVGHITPGTQVVVSSTWAMPLSASGEHVGLRIPVTVGDIFGRSPLSDSDDLVHGGAAQYADIEVVCSDGVASLEHGLLVEGGARLRLDTPIDIRVTGWTQRVLRGIAADGRPVTLDIRPAIGGQGAINAHVLGDVSGSMGGQVKQGSNLSKLDCLVAGLEAQSARLQPNDQVALSKYSNTVTRVQGRTLALAARAMGGPTGGTNTGPSLLHVGRQTETRDILLLTDGKSHLDVQAVSRMGCRINVILIGHDSLEANVGHLAALSGGQLFVVSGEDMGPAIEAAFAAMRTPHVTRTTIEAVPKTVHAIAGGMDIRADWSGMDQDGAAVDATLGRAVGALAAAMAIPSMTQEHASALAQAEGIVCHLTSLVLVDEAGVKHEGIPAQRKVALMSPACGAFMMASATGMGASGFAASATMSGLVGGGAMRSMGHNSVESLYLGEQERGTSKSAYITGGGWLGKATQELGEALRRRVQKPMPSPMPPMPPHTPAVSSHRVDLKSVGAIDWTSNPDALRRGELGGLAGGVRTLVEQAAQAQAVVALAWALGTNAHAVVMGLLARHDTTGCRTAARLARAVLGGADEALVLAAARVVGLA